MHFSRLKDLKSKEMALFLAAISVQISATLLALSRVLWRSLDSTGWRPLSRRWSRSSSPSGLKWSPEVQLDTLRESGILKINLRNYESGILHLYQNFKLVGNLRIFLNIRDPFNFAYSILGKRGSFIHWKRSTFHWWLAFGCI